MTGKGDLVFRLETDGAELVERDLEDLAKAGRGLGQAVAAGAEEAARALKAFEARLDALVLKVGRDTAKIAAAMERLTATGGPQIAAAFEQRVKAFEARQAAGASRPAQGRPIEASAAGALAAGVSADARAAETLHLAKRAAAEDRLTKALERRAVREDTAARQASRLAERALAPAGARTPGMPGLQRVAEMARTNAGRFAPIVRLGGAPLDMSADARARRAEAQGYGPVYHHGTQRAFEQFQIREHDVGVHMGTLAAAKDRLAARARSNRSRGRPNLPERILDLRVRGGREIEGPDMGYDWADADRWRRWAVRSQKRSLAERVGLARPTQEQQIQRAVARDLAAALKPLEGRLAGPVRQKRTQEIVQRVMAEHDIASYRYKNIAEDTGSRSRLVFDTGRIRATDAAFDPAHLGEPGILKSLAAEASVRPPAHVPRAGDRPRGRDASVPLANALRALREREGSGKGAAAKAAARDLAIALRQTAQAGYAGTADRAVQEMTGAQMARVLRAIQYHKPGRSVAERRAALAAYAGGDPADLRYLRFPGLRDDESNLRDRVDPAALAIDRGGLRATSYGEAAYRIARNRLSLLPPLDRATVAARRQARAESPRVNYGRIFSERRAAAQETEDVRARRRALLDSMRAHTAKLGHEAAVTTGPGQPAVVMQGDGYSVIPFPPRRGHGAAALVHTHPGVRIEGKRRQGGPFSAADWGVLATEQHRAGSERRTVIAQDAETGSVYGARIRRGVKAAEVAAYARAATRWGQEHVSSMAGDRHQRAMLGGMIAGRALRRAGLVHYKEVLSGRDKAFRDRHEHAISTGVESVVESLRDMGSANALPRPGSFGRLSFAGPANPQLEAAIAASMRRGGRQPAFAPGALEAMARARPFAPGFSGPANPQLEAAIAASMRRTSAPALVDERAARSGARASGLLARAYERIKGAAGGARTASRTLARATDEVAKSAGSAGRASRALSSVGEAGARGLQSYAYRLGPVADAAGAMGGKALAAVGAVGALAFGMQRAMRVAREASRAYADTAKAADALNVSSDTFQGLRAALVAGGHDTGVLASALGALEQRSLAARRGTGELFTALKASHPEFVRQVAAAETNEERLRALDAALRATASESERATLAYAAFGASGKALAGVLVGLEGGLDAQIAAARELGLVMGRETLDRAAEAEKRFRVFADVISTNVKAAFYSLFEPMDGVAGRLADLSRQAAQFADALADIDRRQDATLESQLINLLQRRDALEAKIAARQAARAQGGLAGVAAVLSGVDGAQNEALLAARLDLVREEIAKIDAEKLRRRDRPDKEVGPSPFADFELPEPAGRDNSDAIRRQLAQLRAEQGDISMLLALKREELDALAAVSDLDPVEAARAWNAYREGLEASLPGARRLKALVDGLVTAKQVYDDQVGFINAREDAGDLDPAAAARARQAARETYEQADPGERRAAEVRERLKSADERLAEERAAIGKLVEDGKLTGEQATQWLVQYERSLADAAGASARLRLETRLLDGVLNGTINSWEDVGTVAVRVLGEIIRESIIAQQGTRQGLGGFIGNVFNSVLGSLGFGGGGGSANGNARPTYHSGGLVSRGGVGRERRVGGPGAHEVDARLEVGERVLTRADNARMAGAIEAALARPLITVERGTGGAERPVNVTLVNQAGQPLEADARRAPDGSIEVTLRQAVKSMIASGELDGAMRGRFGARAQAGRR